MNVMLLTENTAKHYFQSLETAISSFNRRWPKQVVDIGLFIMPVYARDKKRDMVPQRIEPKLVTGKRAVALAQKGLAGFRRRIEQNPSSVIRYPGWISVKHSMMKDIQVINELKTELQATMKELEPVEVARVALTRELFPNRSMLQVYRHLFAHEQTVRRLEFTWSQATLSTRKIDPGAAIKRLEASLQQPVPSEYKNRSTWQAVVQKEIRDIENAKKGTLVVKKPVAPHPKMIVYFSGDKPSGAPRHDKLHPANLPLFINADKDLVVSPLKSFEFDRERPAKRARKPIRWISKPLGIATLS